MSTTKWAQRSHISIIDDLIDRPQAYDFLQAVRIIKHHEFQSKTHSPYKESQKYSYPYLKFKSSMSLAFPVAEIEELTVKKAELDISSDIPASALAGTETQIKVTSEEKLSYASGFELCPAMIGLTGPVGTLPYVYTNSLFGRVVHYHDRAAPAFLDIFNHRMTELYVHASWFYSLPLQYELSSKRDTYISCLRALASQPLAQLSELDAMVSYTGLLRPSRLTAEQVSQVLTAYFRIPVNVEQFIPEWFDLPASQQSCLGQLNSQLGVETFLGSRVLQFDTKVRICFAELDQSTYLNLLPDGEMTEVVFQFLRQWCGTNMAVEIQLELHKSHIKPLSLGESRFGALGRGAFLVSREVTEHSRETRFDLAYDMASMS